MINDKPLLGISLMLGFCLLAPIGDALGKILTASLPVAQIVLARFAAQVVFLGPLTWRQTAAPKLTARQWQLITQRTILHISGIGAMFTSLIYLPLADAVAIAFVMPFLMLLLGKYVLDEVVGLRRLLACLVGFCGTMMVIQPSFANVGAPALLPLLVAVVFALFMLTTRQLAKDIDAIRLQAISGVIAVCLLIPLLILGAALGFEAAKIPALTPGILWMLIFTGVIGTVAHLFMTWSLRFAPSATLAPMQYLEIPVATVLGYLIFGDFPNGLAAIGIAITIAAGLYVIWRERLAAQQSALAEPTAPPTEAG